MIYLDYNATTPIDPKVKAAMEPYINEIFGNPSSNHYYGFKSMLAVKKARNQVASLINSESEEIIFTSGGSEADNMVLKGVAFTYGNKGRHIITSAIEHPAIISPCRYLEKLGYEVTYLPADSEGRITPHSVEKAIRKDTILISIMHSNNETGTLQPIKEIGEIAKKNNVLFHSDASQSLGKVPVDVKELQVDFLTIAGHKMYAPKGIGALFIRKGLEIEPLIHGASHESGRRAGTENVIFDVALGEACSLAEESLKCPHIKELTDYFYDGIRDIFKDKIKLNGHSIYKLPNTLNISFIGRDGNEVLNQLEDVAASTGSACHSGMTEISPVLKAMNIPQDIARGAVRFSLGRFTTKTEIQMVLDKLRLID
ncbi:cysteine desulfurase family protein [Clostridium polynesiense]|uniref:cysteine desulfurase family protein n=1 Tax=Clostridium polynesiense TaxID=1325933 RepID=UPI000B13A67C|nr:cysteine desulfurase family protein [Clostridium polynesiense]